MSFAREQRVFRFSTCLEPIVNKKAREAILPHMTQENTGGLKLFQVIGSKTYTKMNQTG